MVSVSTIDIAHTLECALQGHPDTTTHDHNPIHALMISAINRARVPNPHHQICLFPWCGVKHDPLCCCICFGSNHKTPDCWHLNGLSDNRKELLVKAHSAKIARTLLLLHRPRRSLSSPLSLQVFAFVAALISYVKLSRSSSLPEWVHCWRFFWCPMVQHG